MLPTFEAIGALNQAGVRYVIVGGLAAVLHGVPRLTMDVDFVVAWDPENIKKAFAAVSEVGFFPDVPVSAEDFGDQETREAWIAEKNMVVLNFKHRSDAFQTLDFFVRYPMDFEKMLADSEELDAYGIPARVCSIDDLIHIKLRAGRVKDLDDVKKLEMIRESEA